MEVTFAYSAHRRKGALSGHAAGVKDDPDVHVETRAQWRAWLIEHSEEHDGVWAVTWRKASGRPAPSYDGLVEEALCVGWVDSIARAIDDERTSLRFSRRKRGSAWARTNKDRVARLREAGLMLPAGEAAVAAAQADGSWSRLDDVERGVVPDDLGRALDEHPAARTNFEAFPSSVRRGILEWIVQAKRAETRARRVGETAELAARGERANQWRRKE